MNDKFKNVLIVFLIILVIFLSWLLFKRDYGRYCKPVMQEKEYPSKQEAPGPSRH